MQVTHTHHSPQPQLPAAQPAALHTEFSRPAPMWDADTVRVLARIDAAADLIDYAAALTYAASREWL